MTTKKLTLGAILAAAFLPALGAEGEQAQTRTVERQVVQRTGEAVTVTEKHVFPPMTGMSGRIVKNAPYSAEMVMERHQNLADGNQIARTTTAMSYRDSAGRTRFDMRDANGEVRTITIQDPVERVVYILHPTDKTATKVSRAAMGGAGTAEAGRAAAEAGRAAAEAGRAGAEAGRATAEAGRAAAEAAQARVEQLHKEGKLPAVERRQTPAGEEIVIRRFQRIETVKPGATQEIRTQLGPVLADAFGDIKWSAHAATKDLGSRDFDGVKAQGKLRSYEIPAGAIGNRNPITVSDESWYAPELQVTMYTKHSDPRSGDSVHRLQNLKRDEPAAALFKVPADYTVKDVMANIKRKTEEKAQ